MTHVAERTAKTLPSILTSTEIRCFEAGCHGQIKSETLKEILS
jgi:hypothetical protein